MNTQIEQNSAYCGCQLIVSAVDVYLGNNQILNRVSLQADVGEFIALIGPSGSGKTTLLRALAGFVDIGHGTVGLRHPNGEWLDISSQPAQERPIAMVFQDLALYPHMTAFQNVAFAAGKKKSTNEINELLDLMGIGTLRQRYPHQMSGGQQQRLALARAISIDPEIILMDEPFANLDAWLRAPLGQEIKRILKGKGITTVMVTHDTGEAFSLADKVIVMFEGAVKQIGEPHRVYAHPINTFVARFIGNNQIVRGKVIPGGWAKTALGLVSLQNTTAYKEGQQVYVLVRPSDIQLEKSGDTCAVVTGYIARGNSYLANLTLANGERVYCRIDDKERYSVGEPVIISVSDTELAVYNDYI